MEGGSDKRDEGGRRETESDMEMGRREGGRRAPGGQGGKARCREARGREEGGSDKLTASDRQTHRPPDRQMQLETRQDKETAQADEHDERQGGCKGDRGDQTWR